MGSKGKKNVRQFLETNFPPYTNCTIVEERADRTIAVLDYGRFDKIRVTLGYEDDSHKFCKLLQTDFIQEI